MMANMVKADTSAGDPRMHPKAAARFNKLRRTVSENSGVDFLAKCGDVLRPANYKSTKDGVADRSWHKTGRAFDYDQTSKALVIVSEPVGGKQFFHLADLQGPNREAGVQEASPRLPRRIHQRVRVRFHRGRRSRRV